MLAQQGIDPQLVLVLRHRPYEPTLRKVLPWFAADKPAIFNAYQRTQGPALEGVMVGLEGEGYLASFIGTRAGAATFVGLFRITGSKSMSFRQYWARPEHKLLRRHGMGGLAADDPRETIRWFALAAVPEWNAWSGRLVVSWPPPERSWWRRAHRNAFEVQALLEESSFASRIPDWHELELTWDQLRDLPISWRAVLAQWRGIYFIHDAATRKGYVGSAYGEENILGRWLQYARTGHGGNALLRRASPGDLRFTILERLAPDAEPSAVIQREASWKRRLHTRAPNGLNDN